MRKGLWKKKAQGTHSIHGQNNKCAMTTLARKRGGRKHSSTHKTMNKTSQYTTATSNTSPTGTPNHQAEAQKLMPGRPSLALFLL
jgi:hypothetical protein